MSTSIGLVGFGLLALACAAFFALLAGALVYVIAFGTPETKRWNAFAVARGWECDGPWRLSGGTPDARWTLGADYDDDRGTGGIDWTWQSASPSAPRLLVVRRADYERIRAGSSLANCASRLGAVALDVAMAAAAAATSAGGGHAGGSVTLERRSPVFDGLRDTGVGSPRFRQRWVVLAEDERAGRTFLDAEAEGAWLTALDAMPHVFAEDDVRFEVRAPRVQLRTEGARRRPPFDEVEALVRLGLALAARVPRR